jgi:hypothetical protein
MPLLQLRIILIIVCIIMVVKASAAGATQAVPVCNQTFYVAKSACLVR